MKITSVLPLIASAVILSVPQASIAAPPPDYVTFSVGGWQFAPVVSKAAKTATAFLAHYEGADSSGANLGVLLFEKDKYGGWSSKAWTSGTLADAGLYVIQVYADGETILKDSLVAAAVSDATLSCDDVIAVPEAIELGISTNDPMYAVVKGLNDPGPTLNVLKQAGYAVVPELPAITAVIAAKLAGDQKAVDLAMTLATGSPSPTQEPGAVKLDGANWNADAKGTQALLNGLAAQVENALFGASVASLWPFCGCSTSYGSCTFTGTEYPCGSSPSTGHQLHCKYCMSGTKTYTYTGQTFWTCSACSGGGTVSCEEITSHCTVYCTPCPATMAGCPAGQNY